MADYNVLQKLATRAMPRTTTSGAKLAGINQKPTGNILKTLEPGYGPVKAGTQNITYASPGQPLYMRWDPTMATEAYYRSLWVMRCVRTIAETLAMLPFRAGKNARDPKNSTLDCALAHFLGPLPGSPNPRTSSRALWAWSAVQYLVTGKMGWETQVDSRKNIVGLWPLVSQALKPIPAFGKADWWDGFQYQTPFGLTPLTNDQVLYLWRPSQRDFRQPESALESATTAIELQVGIERFMWGLLRQGLTAAHVIITPPFEESDMRRAWQEQFLQEFTGFNNAGKLIFGEAELGEKDQRIPNVQIQQVGTRPVDAQLLQMWQQAKIDITVTLGVPESLIGNASQRTYCVDSTTESLTSEGWRTLDQITPGTSVLTLNHRTGMAEWQPVEHIQRFEVVDEPMLHMTARSHDSLTTAAHRWPVLDHDYLHSDKRGWQLSEHLTESHRIISAAQVKDLPTEAKYTDAMVELLAWHWTEGSITHTAKGTLGTTIISQSGSANPAYCERISAVLHRLFGPPKDTHREGDGTGWTERRDRDRDMRRFVLGRSVSAILEELAPSRCPTPEFILALTRSQLDLFIDVSLMADGFRTNADSRIIGQSKPERLDGIELATILSGRTPYRWESKHNGLAMWFLCVSERTVAGVPRLTPVGGKPTNAHREWVDYTGTVWCPTVRNGTWMARRNGKVFFTGNSNADSEYRNFWTITMMNFIAEIEDGINTYLAPRLGKEVGWFDTSKVVALQPPQVLTPLDAVAAIEADILTPQDVASILDLVELEGGAEDVETAPLGQEAIKSSAVGRSLLDLELRARRINNEHRAMTLTQSADIADKVHGYLARSYPRKTLTWVHDARWEHKKVPLDSVQMERRPGGRDLGKVESMSKALRSGARLDPVVLVQPSGEQKARIADGYHRSLAHRRSGRTTIDAYLGVPATSTGPWETQMHATKKNRAMELVEYALWDPERRSELGLEPDNVRAGVCTGDGPCDTGEIGPGPNWVTKVNGLPVYIRAIAHALIRDGHSEQDAIRLAVGTVRRWAEGGGKVTAATRERAGAALAEWEAKKSESHERAVLGYAPSAGPKYPGYNIPAKPVLPYKTVVETNGKMKIDPDVNKIGPHRPEPVKLSASTSVPPRDRPAYAKRVAHKPHAFQGTNLAMCSLCNQPVLMEIHRAAFSERAASPPFVAAR